MHFYRTQDTCRICGLQFSSQSYGGPGICPSCDCGNFGQNMIEKQRKTIERLERELAEARSGTADSANNGEVTR